VPGPQFLGGKQNNKNGGATNERIKRQRRTILYCIFAIFSDLKRIAF
jgi:hypothetical protein